MTNDLNKEEMIEVILESYLEIAKELEVKAEDLVKIGEDFGEEAKWVPIEDIIVTYNMIMNNPKDWKEGAMMNLKTFLAVVNSDD